MKKAFTLIELIATIVILGVVTSIVSILIMNVIRNVKDSVNKRSIDNYGRIIETSMAEYQSQYLKYPDSIDQLEIEYVGSVIECEIRRINPDKTIYLSECKVNGKKVLDKSTEDGYYHYGTLVLTNEEYVDKLGNNIEVALKDYYEENNKYPVNYRLLNLPTLDKDVNCVSKIHQDGTVYLTKCSIDGRYIMNENEEDGYYHYGRLYDYIDKDGNGYIEVEYLESTGTQYIDTGIIPKTNTKFILDAKYVKTKNDEDFGVNDNNKRFHIGIYRGYFHFGVGSVWKNVMPYDTERHVFYLDAYGNIKIDDNNYSTGSQLLSNINLSIYLFSLHGLNGRNVYSKLYSSKIYDGDTLIRDYIPVIDPSERPCLFDKVGKECYYNQGTGEFLYG